MKYFFFLGGHDGEMIEIRNLLEAKHHQYVDKHLAWGASISDYDADIKNIPQNAVPVFIELAIDRPLPEGAVIIDHHNEKAGRDQKTSLEQVADLLNLPLNRRQQLISANDRGHIRAMRKIGATDEEIESIRLFDRKAQGVSDEDERLAALSIDSRLESPFEDTAVIESKTNKTSPVFDRLYEKYAHVFVYTPDGEINYSGSGDMVNALQDFYRNEYVKKERIPEGSAASWYGGNLPETGFWGAKTAIHKNDLIRFLEKHRRGDVKGC